MHDAVAESLVALEHEGWEALSTSGERATDFYGQVLDEDIVMLLPGGMVIDDHEAALAAMSGQPWDSYALTDERVLLPGEGVGIVRYGVRAERSGSDPYTALVSSAYVRRPDGWRLAFHQQTPF
jgi:hypothetical protein